MDGQPDHGIRGLRVDAQNLNVCPSLIKACV